MNWYITKSELPADAKIIPIHIIATVDFPQWFSDQTEQVKTWITHNNFTAEPFTFCLIPNEKNEIKEVIWGVNNYADLWNIGNASSRLPPGFYQFSPKTSAEITHNGILAWGLGAYRFSTYKKNDKPIAKMVLSEKGAPEILELVKTIYSVRDWINTPTDDMGPDTLAQIAVLLAEEFDAKVKQIIGEDLLKDNYPTIHAVGRASNRQPRMIEIRWGKASDFKLCLVGKGVCFDSGGLDIKTASGMALMKKDMGGAAHVLGLARMIMAMQLPINLRVLVPAVENVIAGNAYHPGDIIKTRKGITVEVTNTDAEGRLILCDALAAAVEEKPDLIIDFATLTGAAKIALGTDLPALFSNDSSVSEALIQSAKASQDYIWPMPLFAEYRELIKTPFADLVNSSASSYAGAITAALFLQEFVGQEQPWVHFDLMAWNMSDRPGRPQGAEAQALRAVYNYLKNKLT